MAVRPISEVVEQYVDNLGYFVTGSTVQAGLFITAVMELLVRRPETIVVAGNTTKFSHSVLQKQLEEAQNWLAANRTTVVNSQYYDISNIRGPH